MTLALIRYAGQPDSRWANGLGSTRVLWADAAGERRISIAKLEGPAPFSALPGIARALAVIDPIHLRLRISGREIPLGQRDILHFCGNEPAELLHLSQPGRVLNLMARATHWSPQISAPPAPGAFASVVLQESRQGRIRLHAGDLLFGATGQPNRLGIDFRRPGLAADNA